GLRIDFWINIILTFLGWLPGLFHAFYVIYKYRGDDSNQLGTHEAHGTYGTHEGVRPQKIKIHSADSPQTTENKYQNQPQNQPQYPSENYQSQYQTQDKPYNQPQYQQQYTPPSTPPQTNKDKGKDPFHDDNAAGPSNEIPPAYGDHKNNELRGESDSY
ncbi:hypothetical protein C1645_154514, partial [Glomus cerebriforme]